MALLWGVLCYGKTQETKIRLSRLSYKMLIQQNSLQIKFYLKHLKSRVKKWQKVKVVSKIPLFKTWLIRFRNVNQSRHFSHQYSKNRHLCKALPNNRGRMLKSLNLIRTTSKLAKMRELLAQLLRKSIEFK